MNIRFYKKTRLSAPFSMEINSNCQKIVSFFRRLSAPISMEIINDCQLDCQLFFAIIAHFFFENQPAPMICPWSAHDLPMICPWSAHDLPVYLQGAPFKMRQKFCTCEFFSILQKSRKIAGNAMKNRIFSPFFLKKKRIFH